MPLDATIAPAVFVPPERTAMRTTAEDEKLGLAGRALRALRAFFDAKDHRPSEGHWVALRAIVSTMDAMASGRCPAKIHLSPCDPGVGKTQSVVHFARELVADPGYRKAGMFVSAFTIAEVQAMAAALADIRGSLCVLTSNPDVNALGGAAANEAQVLLTTQSRLGRLTAEHPFASVTAFHYQGTPRACRVWDESLLPGSTIVIEADAVMGMASRLRAVSGPLTDALYRFGGDLMRAEDGAKVTIPDFETEHGSAFEQLVSHLTSDSGAVEHSRDRDTAAALRLVNGSAVRVRRDSRSDGRALLTYREELPADLPPMLVLDASGRVRETYALWQASRQALTVLPDATRDYSPLTAKVWKTAGSKSGWGRNAGRLAEGIAVTVESKPDERWLIVSHKPTSKIMDLEAALRARLAPALYGLLSFTTWGRHTGVNDWADIPNVILAGTLFYPDSHVTALHHLCAHLPVEAGLVKREEVKRTEMGEHRHLVFQAACRGRARRSDGDRCQPMTLYVIASPKSRIEGELPDIFPGSRVETWKPLKVAAAGTLGTAIDWLTTAIEEGRTEVSYAEVYTAVGVEKSNFMKRIAKAEAWKAAVTALRAETIRGSRGQLYVRLMEAPA